MSDQRPVYDPHDPDLAVHGTPFELLARLRRSAPVARTPSGAWYLARRAEADAVLGDVDHFGSDMTPGTGIDGVDAVPAEQLFLPEIREPTHGKVRRLYNAALGPHRLGRIQPFVRAACESLLDALLAAPGPVDLHEGYAMPLPAQVIAHIIGLPSDAAAKLVAWSFDGSVMCRPASAEYAPVGPPIHPYLRDIVAAERRAEERSSHTFDVFLDAEIDGAPLTDVQIAHQLQTMVLGGVHTTRGLLAHSVQRLLVEPRWWPLIDADRTLVEPFVEESLRHDSPAPRVSRRCLAATTVGPLTVAAGELVEVGLASANRDESIHHDGDDFRLDRPNARDHVAFGGGPHVCPGAALARLEGVTAIETLLDRLEGMHPVDGHAYPPLPANLGYAPLPAHLAEAAG